MERLRADVEHLAAQPRGSASAGERTSARWIAGRLRQAGAADVAVEPYRGRGTYAWGHALLACAGLGVRRMPSRVGRVAPLALLGALEADASGALGLPVGTATGANVVGRVAAAGARTRTLVLAAHHDTQRSGVVWHPALHRPGAAGRLRRRAIPRYLAPPGLALGLARTRLGRLLLAVWLFLAVEQASNRSVPGANDNASGVAALLALVERWAAAPLDGVEVVAVAAGSEESGSLGMRALLRSRALDPATTLVLSLDTLGCGKPVVLRAEHTLRRHAYAERDLALVPPSVERWSLGGWTDALPARRAGLRALSLLSMGPEGRLTHYHRPDDLPEHVDYASVEACVAVAVAVAEAFARER